MTEHGEINLLMAHEIRNIDGGMVFRGREAVNAYADIVMASALHLYAKTKIKVNRAYTPTNMLAYVERRTGVRFRRGQYREAAEALQVLVDQSHSRISGKGD